MRLLPSLALCCLLPLCAGAAERLNVKPGLWEITTVSQTSGMLPLPRELLDNMTAEQRAKLQADMQAAQAQPTTDTARECITEQDIERPFASSNAKHCTQHIVTTTRSTQEVHIECSGEPRGSGVLRVTTASPEAMTGTLEMQLGSGAETFTMKSQLKGRWLGRECGSDAANDDAAP